MTIFVIFLLALGIVCFSLLGAAILFPRILEIPAIDRAFSPAADADSGRREVFETDLDIHDVWESPNGNAFIKMSDDYSMAIGPRGGHSPNVGDLKRSQYVKANKVTPVKKIGRIVWD